jgi:hypothetical protein
MNTLRRKAKKLLDVRIHVDIQVGELDSLGVYQRLAVGEKGTS